MRMNRNLGARKENQQARMEAFLKSRRKMYYGLK
jgi:hypothetical protein